MMNNSIQYLLRQMQAQPTFTVRITKLKCQKLSQKQIQTIQTMMKQQSCQLVTYLGVQYLQQFDIIALSGKLTQFDLKKTKTIHEKIQMLKQLIQTVNWLHGKGYSLNCKNIEDLLLLDQFQKIKLLSYGFSCLSEKINKKINVQLCQLPEISTEKIEPASHVQIDIWKIGKFSLKFIWDLDISEQCNKIVKNDNQKSQKYKQMTLIVKRINFRNQQQIQEKIKSMVKIYPRERIQLKEVLQVLNEFFSKEQQIFTQTTKKIAKKKYLDWQNKIQPIFLIQIKDHILLTEQLTKKLGNHFKTQGRLVSKMKPIFRGSFFQFSSKMFYQQVSAHENILVVVMVKNQKVKICGYSVNSFDLKKMNGIFGGFIGDSSGKSFLYNALYDDFYKLKDNSKAIGVSMINGPIFGNGDLVIGDKALMNTCKFPISYETGKKKVLLKNSAFEVQEYDVFKIQFKQK